MEFSEIYLVVESGIGVSQDSVSVAWNDTSGGDDCINVVFDFLVRDFSALFLHEFEEPLEHFLVGKTVEGTSKTVNTGRVRKIGIRQGRSDQVG